MEPVTISLNIDKQSMFFLPSGKLHLTYENPGPVELDPASLSDNEKAWINQAYNERVLFVDNPNNKTTAEPTTPEELKLEDRVPVEMKEHIFERQEALREAARSLLTGRANAVKKAVDESDDILLLRLMREVESEGKKRKGILEKLDERIKDVQSNLVHELGGDQGELGTHLTSTALKNLPELDEAEDRVVTGDSFSLDD
jgi:hypothetical protein